MTADDDGESDEGLRSLRAVWLSMPDEDPPERGLAELMAAARVKAEVMAKPSAWQRFLDLLRRPPVMALATVMVLLGGAIFVVNRKDKLAHQPTIQAETEDRGAGELAKNEAPPALEQQPVTPPATIAAPEPETVPAEAPAVATRAPSKKPSSPVSKRPPSAKPMKSAEMKKPDSKEPLEENEAFSGKLQDNVQDKREVTKGLLGGEGDGDSLSDDGKTKGTAPASDPTTTGTASATPPPKQSPPTASQLHTQARSLAARGDCAAARSAVSRIAKQDASYYKANVVNDKSLAKCGTVGF